jgi:hypothetical protein
MKYFIGTKNNNIYVISILNYLKKKYTCVYTQWQPFSFRERDAAIKNLIRDTVQ